MVDSSPMLDKASCNPLDLPILKGARGRRLKVSEAYKMTVARIAAKGDVFRSGRAIVRAMGILNVDHPYLLTSAQKSANKWTEPLAFQYLHRVQEVFRMDKLLVPIISLAWDTTRISKLDTLCATIYNHQLRLAAWCPPQAGILCLS